MSARGRCVASPVRCAQRRGRGRGGPGTLTSTKAMIRPFEAIRPISPTGVGSAGCQNFRSFWRRKPERGKRFPLWPPPFPVPLALPPQANFGSNCARWSPRLGAGAAPRTALAAAWFGWVLRGQSSKGAASSGGLRDLLSERRARDEEHDLGARGPGHGIDVPPSSDRVPPAGSLEQLVSSAAEPQACRLPTERSRKVRSSEAARRGPLFP